VVELIKEVSFNPDVPENHNVKRITSSKDYYKNQFLAVYDEDGKWKPNVKESVLKRVVMKGFDVMIKHMQNMIDSNEFEFEDSVMLNQWIIEKISNPKEFMKDIFALMLDDEFFLLKESDPRVG
jgi:hypothetical protein